MFDRIVVINLKRRKDRLEAFRNRRTNIGWPLREPEIFEAIDGNKVGAPTHFQSGGGAWGCARSHIMVLERALMDGVNSLLILEDDVVWKADLEHSLSAFMVNVPSDWDQLCLGGQHIGEQPEPIYPGVVRCQNCQRTHAYAIRPKAMKSLLGVWYAATRHIDHEMGPWQRDWQVYAPHPFIFGQDASQSDISGNKDHTRYWSPRDPKDDRYRKLPVVVLRAPRGIMDEVRASGFHTGHWRDMESDIDRGLLLVTECLPDTDIRKEKIREWFESVGPQSIDEQAIPTIWHDPISAKEVEEALSVRVVEITCGTVGQLKEKFAAALGAP